MAPPVHKNLTIFVVDVGAYSKQCTDCPASKDKGSYLDKTKQIMINLIKRMMFITPNDEIAIVCYGNSFNWNSINVIDFQFPDWDLVKKIESLDSSELTGNFEEALTIAFETLKKYLETNVSGVRYDSIRVCYFYNCFEKLENRSYDFDRVLTNKEKEIEIWCIGEKSWASMLKDDEVNPDHKKMTDFLEKLSDKYLTMDAVMEETMFVGSKLVRVIPSNVELSLSDIKIPIAIYKMIENEMLKPEMSANCDRTISYLDSNKEVVDPSETIKAYKFGHRLVPVTEEDQQRMKHGNEEKELKIMGFLNKDDVTFDYWGMSPARLVLPFKDSLPEHSSDYYSLHESMHRQNTVALVRGVLRTATEVPKIGFLYPETNEKSSIKAFVFIDMPYEEQQYSQLFKQIPESFEIEQEISQSIRDFINKSTLHNPEDGKEYMAPGTVMNPALQNYWDSIAFRILNEDKPLDEMKQSRVLDVLKQPQFVVDKSKESAENLRKLFQKYVRTDDGVQTDENQKSEDNQEKNIKAEVGTEKKEEADDNNEQYFDDEDFPEVMDF